MGLLKVGKPKTWNESKTKLSYIRSAGVRQFISTYNRVKNLKGDELLWGDEIEYGIYKIDTKNKKVRLSLRAKEIMDELNEKEIQFSRVVEGCNWVPEYGAWMVEATPNRPYTGYTTDLLRVERNMRLRRKRILTALHDDEIAPTLSAYPLLGAQGNDGTVPSTKIGGPCTESEYISDDIINPHPRFGTLTSNIRQRRGSKVNIRLPLFRDINTPEYKGFPPPKGDVDGCCGSDSQQLWRYGKGDPSMERYGKDRVVVGCSKSTTDEENDDNADVVEQGLSLQKWLVNVNCPGCLGLFYRRAPNEIVPDADWPRNGDIVVGYELPENSQHPGWIRLQNGYYLPLQSDDGKVQFLHKVWSRTIQPNNSEMKRIGSNTPLFRMSNGGNNNGGAGGGNGVDPNNNNNNNNGGGGGGSATTTTADVASLLDGKIELAAITTETTTTITTIDNGNDESGAASSSIATSAAATTTTTTTTNAAAAVADNNNNDLKNEENVRASIHMDAMAFGMGNCCLQVTFQARDIDESRFIYDQLAVMAPIMMALTASTPIVKGRLADTDARWGIISESVDDRTPAERGRPDTMKDTYNELNARGSRRIFKSRYDSISTYIYQGAISSPNESRNGGGLNNRVLNIYNDIPVPVDEDTYQLLRKNGIDPALAQHVAHLFIRDPLVIFDGAVEELDDETQTEHWESIQSTNWQSVRWKPPPPRNSPNDPHIGWRTEFRTMELQLTDFENAAFTVFTVLLTRVILAFDLNFYIPMSRVDANMQRAHSRGASSKGKFFFRRHAAPLEEGDDGYGVKYVSMFSRVANGVDTSSSSSSSSQPSSPQQQQQPQQQQSSSNFNGHANGDADEVDENGVSTQRRKAPVAPGSSEENSYEEMTMAEIMCGKGDYFPGLIPLIQAYLDHINVDSVTRKRLLMYLDFIERRATGELVTPAAWMRNFVRNHPSYMGDSVVSDEIAYDLMIACRDIGLGKLHVPELLGDVTINEVTKEGAYDVKMDSNRIQNEQLVSLLRRYTNRTAFKSS